MHRGICHNGFHSSLHSGASFRRGAGVSGERLHMHGTTGRRCHLGTLVDSYRVQLIGSPEPAADLHASIVQAQSPTEEGDRVALAQDNQSLRPRLPLQRHAAHHNSEHGCSQRNARQARLDCCA